MVIVTVPVAVLSCESCTCMGKLKVPALVLDLIAAADQLQVSNRSGKTPVTSFTIPGNARTGYYDIVTTAAQKDFSVTGGEIIKVRR